MKSMIKSKRFGAVNAFSLATFILVAVMLGCKSPTIKSAMVQSHMPYLAPAMVGPLACPHCGLLRGQGCSCRPDLWSAGYHPTCWSYIDVEPCSQQPCGLPQDAAVHPSEVLPGAEMNTQPALPAEVQAAPNEALPQPVIQQPPMGPQPPMGDAQPEDQRQGSVRGENRRWVQATRNRMQQVWDNTTRPAAWFR